MMGKLQDPPYSAVSLAAPPSSGLYAFRPLDQEQIAEDALAIILLCALRHEDDIAGASTSGSQPRRLQCHRGARGHTRGDSGRLQREPRQAGRPFWNSLM